MILSNRLIVGLKAGAIHLFASLVVAVVVAVVVFYVWYPHPFRFLSGGEELFFLVVGVDIVCGPILTVILFNPVKKRRELLADMALVVCMQSCALAYGVYSVWLARPLFLVMEIDRFRVIASPDLNEGPAAKSFSLLPLELRPSFGSGPLTVAIRKPVDENERTQILFESIKGGRDYAFRPDFYLPYEGENAFKSLKSAKPLSAFLKRWPDQKVVAEKLALDRGIDLAVAVYLPVVGRQDWVAVLDKKGQIQGFLKGDGF